MSIIYSENSGFSNAAIGKLETPIKMVIEHESDLQTKRGGICDWLFNVERSTRFGETILMGVSRLPMAALEKPLFSE